MGQRPREAPEERQAAVLALAEGILTGPTSWEAASETGSTDFAGETAELEARTGLLSNYQPAAMPGLLQTTAYARRLLASGPAGRPPTSPKGSWAGLTGSASSMTRASDSAS